MIPYHGPPDLLRRAVVSALGQAGVAFEVIVVDDAAPHPAKDVLAGMSRQNLRIIRHAQRRGAGAARNTGIGAATGKYIAFLDADDVWGEDKLAAQFALLEAETSVDLCVTAYWLHRGSGEAQERQPAASEIKLDHIVFGCGISPGSTLFLRTSVFSSAALFDEDLMRLEDWDWLLRVLPQHRLLAINRPYVDIYQLQAPDLRHVQLAVAALRRRHGCSIRKYGFLNWQRFSAALENELAVALYRAGHPVRAMGRFLRSFAHYPLRKPQYFLRIAIGTWIYRPRARRGTNGSPHPTDPS